MYLFVCVQVKSIPLQLYERTPVHSVIMTSRYLLLSLDQKYFIELSNDDRFTCASKSPYLVADLLLPRKISAKTCTLAIFFDDTKLVKELYGIQALPPMTSPFTDIIDYRNLSLFISINDFELLQLL